MGEGLGVPDFDGYRSSTKRGESRIPADPNACLSFRLDCAFSWPLIPSPCCICLLCRLMQRA